MKLVKVAVPLNRSGAALRRAVCRQDGLQQRPTSRSPDRFGCRSLATY